MKNFDKAKKQNKNKNKKWYILHTKNYSYYIWALPLLPFVILVDYIKHWHYNQLTWSNEKAIKVLNKALPKIIEWIEEDKSFYYCMDWGTSQLYNNAPFFSRKWARKFARKLQCFIKEDFEIEGYKKSIEIDNYEEVWVRFSEN